MLGQFSKFIEQGATRIFSSVGSYDTVTNVAFRNPDGTLVCVMVNQTNAEQDVTLVCQGRKISATVPAKTTATYVWEETDGSSSSAIDAYDRVDAVNFDESGSVTIYDSHEGGQYVGGTGNGSFLRYDEVDFGAGDVERFYARVATPQSGAQIAIYLDDMNGTPIGTLDVNNTGGWADWKNVSCTVSEVTGVHTVYLKVLNASLNIRKWNFNRITQYDHSNTTSAYTTIWNDTYDPAISSSAVAKDYNPIEHTYVGWIDAGEYLGYSNIDFGATAPQKISLKYANQSSSRPVEVRLDSPTGELIAKLEVQTTWNWDSFGDASAAVKPGVTGVHDVYLVFPQGEVNVSWMRFQEMMQARNPAGTNTFENNSWDNWTFWQPQGQSPAYAIATDDPHGSTYYGRLSSNQAFEQGAYRAFNGLRNGQYTVTAWVKQDGGTPEMCQMEVNHHGGSKVVQSIPSSDEYVMVQQTVMVTTGRLEVGFFISGPAGTALKVDDIYLCGLPVYNPGFENGNFAGWTSWKPDGQADCYQVNNSSVFNGNYSCTLYGDTAFSQGVYRPFENIANGTYTVTAWVKQDVGDPEICKMEILEYGGNDLSQEISHGDGFVCITQTVTVTSGKLTVGFFTQSNGGSNLVIDDVSIAKNMYHFGSVSEIPGF
jgi:hypothetical protein